MCDYNKKTEIEIVHMIELANEAYFNSDTPLMSDAEYDRLIEYTQTRFPNHPILRQIGNNERGTTVVLPYKMPSLNKIKPTSATTPATTGTTPTPAPSALEQWTKIYNKEDYLLSYKLDGVSGLYVCSNSRSQCSLYTRGDGTLGRDVSHLLNVLDLPILTPATNNNNNHNNNSGRVINEHNEHSHCDKVVIRGEFILSKPLFAEKYSTQFSNIRNLVSGIINSKTMDEKTRDLHFVAYEVVYPPMKPSDQFAWITNAGFRCVVYQSIRAPLTEQHLIKQFLEWRNNPQYEIDGVVVRDNHSVVAIQTSATTTTTTPPSSATTQPPLTPAENPPYAFAFKMRMDDQMTEATVVDVIWTPSKSGYLKPRVRIEPITISGVRIEYATGFNGQFIRENKIGKGAVISLVRSGDVIPHICSVIRPCVDGGLMPTVPYIWTETGVDVVLKDIENDETVLVKNMVAFFAHLKVDGLSTGNITKFVQNGYCSVPKILAMERADYKKMDGFQSVMGEKIEKSIRAKIADASLLDIVVASNKLGRGLGYRKTRLIMEQYPMLFTEKDEDVPPEKKIEKLMAIKGIGVENAHDIVENIPAVLAFLQECKLGYKLDATTPPSPTTSAHQPALTQQQHQHPLYGKKIVMSKTRDKEIIQLLAQYGATLEEQIKKDTFILIVKTKTDKSNKIEYAQTNRIRIMTPEEFLLEYIK